MKYSAQITISVEAQSDEEAIEKLKEIEQHVEINYSFFFYLWNITLWNGVTPRTVFEHKKDA